MVEIGGTISNREDALPDDLSALFDTLADWEHQLQRLPPEDLAYLEDISEEPSP